MTATAPEAVVFMEAAGMPLSTESRKRFTAVQEPTRLAYQSLVDFVPGHDPYEFGTEVVLTPTDGGTHVVMTVEEPARRGLDPAPPRGPRQRAWPTWTGSSAPRDACGRASPVPNGRVQRPHDPEERLLMTIRFENVGIAVRDLDEAITFFTALGLSVQGRDTVSGSGPTPRSAWTGTT